MATKKGDPNGRGMEMRRKIAEAQGEPFNEVTWIDPTLTDEESALLKSWGLDSGKLDGYTEDLCAEGLRVTINFDSHGNCYACRLWPDKNDVDRRNKCVVGRGSTPLKALRQAIYKHFVMLECDWSRWDAKKIVRTFDD